MQWQSHTCVQLLIFKKDEERPRKSQVFKEGDCHAEIYAISYLKENSVEKVIFVQNYGPCQNCAKEIAALKEKKKNITVEVVYTKKYTLKDNGLKTLEEANVNCHQITNWRWNAFLLWNAGSLPNDTHWWSESYEDCEDAMAGGLEQQGIDSTHSSVYLKRLQEKGSFGGGIILLLIFQFLVI